MATYTADAAHSYVQPRLNYEGPTQMVSRYIAGGTTISSGDVYLLAKIPNGATITDLRWYGRSSGTGGVVFNLGTAASASLLGAVTISATDQYITAGTTALPYTVSLSDDTVNQYLVLQATVASGSATATGTFGIVVTYASAGASRP